MKEVHLGFKAFDLHELACHFVARHAGIAKGTVKEKDREGLEQRISSGVSQMFANYPFRAGSGAPAAN